MKRTDISDLISVIVPIYNAGEYIEGCVKSVMAQTYSDFELILIDDGSEDCSRDICKDMLMTDKRIKLLFQKHKGVSAARNAGVKASEGKYLFFLDADDVVHPQLLEVLYHLLEESGAMIATESRYYAPGGEFQKPVEWELETDSKKDNFYLDSGKAIRSLIHGEREATLYVIGGKMILRELTRLIQFDEKLSHGEDTLFLYQLLEEGADVVVLGRNWYYYRMYGESATGIFSVPSCQSRYAAEQYIRNREIRYGRMSNAVHWEGAIARAMMVWYEVGRSRQDDCLITYVKELAENEKKLQIFSEINRIEKIRFNLVFHCYPIYQVFQIMCSFALLCLNVCIQLRKAIYQRGCVN